MLLQATGTNGVVVAVIMVVAKGVFVLAVVGCPKVVSCSVVICTDEVVEVAVVVTLVTLGIDVVGSPKVVSSSVVIRMDDVCCA